MVDLTKRWSALAAAMSLAGVCLPGCSSTRGLGVPLDSQDGWLTSRVSMGPACIVDEYGKNSGGFINLLTILGPVILPNLIDAGLSLVSHGIRDVASAARTNVVARTNGHFLRGDTNSALYRAHEDLGCIVFAYGRMTTSGAIADNLPDAWTLNRDAFEARGFSFAEEPLFYFEGIVRFADDGEGSFSISTAYVHMSEKLRRARFFADDEDALLTFTFQQREGLPVAVGAIPFADLTSATTVSGDALVAYSTGWMPLPQPSVHDQVRLALHCGQQGCPASPAGTESGNSYFPACGMSGAVCAQPYTLIVEFSRSSNVSAALTELANQLDYARPAIAPRIQQELTSEASERLNFVTPSSEQTARLGAAHAACEELSRSRRAYDVAALEARAAMSADVRAKVSAAQAAYQAAGMQWWNVVADSAMGCLLTRGAGGEDD